ncbi:cyanobactin maturation protease PatG family protein [Kineosporia succinea]|uniref:Subtilase family protein n=1 Tax=Kineosporia succinea TaxID=84632 RepID=A0ABT9PBN6_9ACTN|nr:S8 family serine peptidase [Kineosporia succinea]MDP9830113.1 hypothetical protein [Kineosporia succinea]
MVAAADIPGLRDLWRETRGDPEIRIGLIEGVVDSSHEAFAGADLELIDPPWLAPTTVEDYLHRHGTFIASQIFGQGERPVPGVAPRCRGLVVTAGRDLHDLTDQLNLVRAFDTLMNAGVHVVHFGIALPSTSGAHVDLIRRAVASAEEAGVLVIAPAGNNYGEVQLSPSTLPTVLTVGAMDDDGQMYKFSNFGPRYRDHGIVAPGGNITGARPGGGTEVQKGTSCSTPIVTGVAGLLLSLQRRYGLAVDPPAVRQALIDTAVPIPAERCHGEPERGLSGLLDIPGAMRQVLSGSSSRGPMVDAPVAGSPGPPAAAAGERVTLSLTGVQEPGLVFALGKLGYDFGSPARKEAFAQRMPPVSTGRVVFPAQPDDVLQMAAHLRTVPGDITSLIWTTSQDHTPLYALEAVGAHPDEAHERLVALLEGQVAVAGRLCGRRVELLSGQVVPVVEVEAGRHLHGWSEEGLVRGALGAGAGNPAGLREFLARVRHDLRNPGVSGADRARNYAATNVVQAASVFTEAAAAGLVLDRIGVERSPYGRADHDCWDVCLSFFDPGNSRRQGRVFRLTIDVSDIQPVGLAPVRSWAGAMRA